MSDKPIDAALEDVTRLYRLVEEMREIVTRLRQCDVEVKLLNRPGPYDPFGSVDAQLFVVLKPGAELYKT